MHIGRGIMMTITTELLQCITGGHGEWPNLDRCQWEGIQVGGRMVDKYYPGAPDDVRKARYLEFRNAADAACRRRQGS